MLFEVYEGEQAMSKDNKHLGNFDLKEIPPAPRGVLQFEVTFDIDANGTLNVTGEEKFTGKKYKITINNYNHRLIKAEFDLMAQDAEDEKHKQTISAQNALQKYCYKMWCAVEDEKLKGRISESHKNTILDKCNDVFCWLRCNLFAEKEEFAFQQKQLESVCNPIMKMLNFGCTGVPREMS
jgi:L1 cell adhesion molecule like protein